MTSAHKFSVAILLFDGVEVLDFAAPFEVFSLAQTRTAPNRIDVTTVATLPIVTARNGLRVCPSTSGPLPTSPDVVVLPGGPGVEPAIVHDSALMAWITAAAASAGAVMSICSGALFLANAGFLRGRRANTHPSDYDTLRRFDPSVELDSGRRFVRDGKFVTSAGISAGLDASLFLLSTLVGAEIATETARWMEYYSNDWLNV